MHSLPNDFDLSFFVGRTLENVSFSETTVFFGFGDHVSVTVLSCLQHLLPSDSEEAAYQSVPLTESRLMRLPGHAVRQVTGDSAAALTLVFDDGQVLKIFDNQPCYEAYWVSNGQREIVV